MNGPLHRGRPEENMTHSTSYRMRDNAVSVSSVFWGDMRILSFPHKPSQSFSRRGKMCYHAEAYGLSFQSLPSAFAASSYLMRVQSWSTRAVSRLARLLWPMSNNKNACQCTPMVNIMLLSLSDESISVLHSASTSASARAGGLAIHTQGADFFSYPPTLPGSCASPPGSNAPTL